MVWITGGARVIAVTDIPCPAIPEGVRLRLLSGPSGAVRRDLRAETRRQLSVLASSLTDGEGSLRETVRGPVGCGAWQDFGMSLAYADHRALVVVARGWRVGVDLLADQQVPEWPAVAAFYLRQAADVARLPEAQQSLAYAAAWVELEAELKCLGMPLREGWRPPADARAVRLTPQIPQAVAAVVLRPVAQPPRLRRPWWSTVLSILHRLHATNRSRQDSLHHRGHREHRGRC